MKALIKKKNIRFKKKAKIRSKVAGTAICPRLSVYRSLKHIYVQAIDDVNGRTLASSSSLDKEIAAGSDSKISLVVGNSIGKKLSGIGIESAVFDRNGFLYHGRIKEVAEGARTAGLKF